MILTGLADTFSLFSEYMHELFCKAAYI
jgi:hypothetical protein